MSFNLLMVEIHDHAQIHKGQEYLYSNNAYHLPLIEKQLL